MLTRKIQKNEYPVLMRQIEKLPESMDMAGTLPPDDYKYLCVIGSRAHTTYGKDVCTRLIQGLRNYPIVIVSGMAIGIDSIAHEAALSADLQTIAFPGSGLDEKVLYPSSRRELARRIIENGGALFSPFDVDQTGTKWTFPVRNSLMAASSHAILIIEAKEKSGTLITATAAGEFSRDLLAVPGDIFSPSSQGPNKLLREGAVAIRNSDDILEALNLRSNTEQTNQTLFDLENDSFSPEEKSIITCLRSGYASSTILMEKTFLEASQFNIIISELELRNVVKESGGRYRLM